MNITFGLRVEERRRRGALHGYACPGGAPFGLGDLQQTIGHMDVVVEQFGVHAATFAVNPASPRFRATGAIA
jgi:hypothetical protein